ncbi:hypothetical protein [Larkinella rosea]|uniref:Ig-like domain-containing protein n=1 Tax=Larkinella rosea TaxID=2025312 RepID=A0A3P1C196_9BACT|nr:hypothetical protein [Larkinella rosea]RRB06843.1 hypothetical protein EHT25_03380 [Larkinella rosea]
MKNTFYFIPTLLLVTVGVAIAQPSRVNIDGTWYTNGQTAYIECGKSNVTVYIDGIQDENGDLLEIAMGTSSNFSFSYTNSLTAQLNLDSNHQDGSIQVTWTGYPGPINVFVKQKPPVPSFTASPALCSTGNSATYSVSNSYNFQGTKPINIVWQTTGGITVNGSSTYTASSTTSSSVTIQFNSFGTVSVYAIIPGCSNLQGDAVTLYVGTPGSSAITFTRSGGSDPGFFLCSGTNYNFVSNPNLPSPQYSYNWSIPIGSSNVTYFSPSGSSATVGAGSAGGGFVLQMDVTQSGCGNTGGSSRTFSITSCFGFRVANNPASDRITVLFDAEYNSEKLPDVLRIANEKSKVVKEVKVKGQYSDQIIKSGLSVDIDVHVFPRGTYYIQGIYGSDKPDQIDPIRIILN